MKVNLLQVIKSVLSAMLGVQSDRNRETDFKQGSLVAYIAVGITATLVFIYVIAKIASSVSHGWSRN